MALTTGSIDAAIHPIDTHRATAPIWIVHVAFETIAALPARTSRLLAGEPVRVHRWQAVVYAVSLVTSCAAAVVAVITR